MGKRQKQLSPKQTDFINKQKLFFVATAMSEGRINLSPKGMDAFRVIDPGKVVWLNLTGSGNETATHLLENGRNSREAGKLLKCISSWCSLPVGWGCRLCHTKKTGRNWWNGRATRDRRACGITWNKKTSSAWTAMILVYLKVDEIENPDDLSMSGFLN